MSSSASSMIHDLKQMYDKLSKWDNPEWKKLLENDCVKVKKTSAVSIFRKKFLSENKNPNKSELFLACSKAWKELEQGEKDEYQRLAEQHNQKFMKPKKAMTGYNLFMKENMSQTKKENPEEENSDILKQTGKKWKSLTKEEQNKYNVMAKQLQSTSEESEQSNTSEQTNTSEETEISETETKDVVMVVAEPKNEKKVLKRKPKN